PARGSSALGRTGVLRHLGVLMDAGLIVTRAEGRVRWNHLNGAPLQRVCDRWMSRHVQVFASAFNRLKSVAEAPEPDPVTTSTPAVRAEQSGPLPEGLGSAARGPVPSGTGARRASRRLPQGSTAHRVSAPSPSSSSATSRKEHPRV
ncbi:MAG: hypothetical protein ACKVZJ_12840, partial [Phycisphaerales bacterium]